MKRREFGGTLAGSLVGTGVAGSVNAGIGSARPARVPRKNTLMHVGGDYHSVVGGRGADMTSKQNLEYNLRHGVKHLTARVSKISEHGAWGLDEMKRMKDNCDRHGMIFEAIRMDDEYIRLRNGPERDRRLDNVLGNIRKASQVGVKVITHHWRVIPIRRNRHAPGRGGVTYGGFKLEDNWQDLPATASGKVTSEDYWERITYFLEKAIPVAAESDVRDGLPSLRSAGTSLRLSRGGRTGTRRPFSKRSNGTKRLSTAPTTASSCVWVRRGKG